MKSSCFALDCTNIRNVLLRNTVLLLRRPLEFVAGFHLLNDIYRRVRAMPESILFERRVLDAMRIEPEVAGGDLSRIPRTGGAVVVSNHPFGGIEGVILLERIKSLRPDVKAMANYMLSAIPEMAECFFTVDPFAGSGAARANLRPMKKCLQWLADGHLLIVFPAGEVAHYTVEARKVRESEWKRNVGDLIAKSRVPVVPVWFEGKNPPFFQFAGLLHPLLRTALLPRQFANKQGRKISFSVGNPIPVEEQEPFFATRGALAAFLRFRAELLHLGGMSGGAAEGMCACDSEIAGEIPADALESEIAALPDGCKIVESAADVVYAVRASQIPNMLKEIGRLRELSFRAAGEGSGKSIDVDEFDKRYVHLVLWSKKNRCVVGAYRMGLVDEIVSSCGVDKLYTSTLFDYRAGFFEAFPCAIELGRSFVRQEYQRSVSALFMLWKGIAGFIALNPRYRFLVGPVSISRTYSPASRELMASVLLQREESREIPNAPRPRSPFAVAPAIDDFVRRNMTFLSSDAVLDSAVRELEPDGKALPVLLRQYLKLNGAFAAFNVDSDFSSVVDGFVIVDMMGIGEKTLRKYMGDEKAEAYRRFHSAQSA